MDRNTNNNGMAEEKLIELIEATKVIEDGKKLEVTLNGTGEKNSESDTPELMEDAGSKLYTAEAVKCEEKSDEEEEKDLILETTEESDNVSDMEEETESLDQSMLSLHIGPEERAQFEDLVGSDTDLRDNPKTRESVTPDSVNDERDMNASLKGENKDEIHEIESDLHCALCGKLFNDARMLKCLHTFCLNCLKKRSHRKHRMTFCPLCFCRTYKPRGGLNDLPQNLVVINLINAQSSSTMDKTCVVCKLGGVETPCAARCLDCDDLLCQDCSGKHTFSRQTARHTIVKLEEDNLEEDVHARNNRPAYCKDHAAEMVAFYCEKCSKCACKDCIQLNHSTHPYVSVNDLYSKTCDHAIQQVNTFKEQATLFNDEKIDSDLIEIEIEQKKQIRFLEDAKAKILQAVEKKFETCVEQLQQEFNHERDLCKQRKQQVTKTRTLVSCVEKNLNFILENGNPFEVLSMQPVLSQTFALLERDVKNTSSAAQQENKEHFSRVNINLDNIKVVSGLSLFNVVKPKSEAKQGHNLLKQSHPVHKNDDKKRNVPVTGKGSFFQQSGSKQNKSQQRTLNKSNNRSTNISAPLQINNNAFHKAVTGGRVPPVSPFPSPMKLGLGRGRLQQNTNKMSLLGEYQGQLKNTGPSSPNFRTQQLFRSSFEACNSNFYGQGQQLATSPRGFNSGSFSDGQKSQMSNQWRHSGGSIRGECYYGTVSLKLSGYVDVSVLLEQSEPAITDMVFTSLDNFAVSDRANKRVKLFDVRGMFLTVVEDIQPMTLTVCRDHLIWNSHFSDIQIYNLDSMTRFDLTKFSNHACHPVTTFKGEKLLVANVHESKIEAFQLEGNSYRLIHSLQPMDREGRPLQKVTHIAAYSNDQLAIIDAALKKVIVTDFDGNCIGEFGSSNFNPGAICIDHHGNIFVTDRANNKLIALTSHGEFIQEWSTFTDSPSAVACNGRGLLLLAGRSKNVNIYQYE